MLATHVIRVLGRELQVKSTSTPQHVAQVEALVNKTLTEAGAAVSGGDSQVVVILAMMNLAESLLTARKELEDERCVSKERLAGLLETLDKAV